MKTDTNIMHIAGYRFVPLPAPTPWRDYFLAQATSRNLKGTVLLSTEGINLNLAGEQEDVLAFQQALQTQPLFAPLSFHETYCDTLPYKRLKVKIKQEIITLREPTLDATKARAPHLAPHTLKTWLDENRDFVLLDTRNQYEIDLGTFERATHLNLSDFNSLPHAIHALPKTKPIVMFCTGGIRCEKAGLYMQTQGFDVYQLDGGILGYFAEMGGAHYQGHCFVFDERIALDPALKPI